MDAASLIDSPDSRFHIPVFNNNIGESWSATRDKLLTVSEFFKFSEKQKIALLSLSLGGSACFQFDMVKSCEFQSIIDRLDMVFACRIELSQFTKLDFTMGPQEYVGDFLQRLYDASADLRLYYGKSELLQAMVAHKFFQGLPSAMQDYIVTAVEDNKSLENLEILLDYAKIFSIQHKSIHNQTQSNPKRFKQKRKRKTQKPNRLAPRSNNSLLAPISNNLGGKALNEVAIQNEQLVIVLPDPIEKPTQENKMSSTSYEDNSNVQISDITAVDYPPQTKLYDHGLNNIDNDLDTETHEDEEVPESCPSDFSINNTSSDDEGYLSDM